MSKYTTYKVLDKTTNTTHDVMAKDSVEAMCQLADLLGIDADDTQVV